MEEKALAKSRKHLWTTIKDPVIASLSQKIETEEQRNALAQAIDINSVPIEEAQLKQCCLYLVAQYTYDNESADKIAATKVSYLYELKDLPAFAIFAAILWWNSRHNPQAGWMPKAGQISARAVIEAELLDRARMRIRMFDKKQKDIADLERTIQKPIKQISLEEFDSWCRKMGINTDPMKKGYHNKRHFFNSVELVLKDMRDGIIAREAEESPATDTDNEESIPLENLDKYEGDTRPR